MKYVKLIFRLLLGAFMTYAGFSTGSCGLRANSKSNHI